MSVHLPRVRQLVGRATLAALVSAPVVLYAQHPVPTQHPKPASTDLHSAIERIQKRVSTTVGAKSVPQTALVSAPKPSKPAEVKAPAKPDKPADAKKLTTAKPAATPTAAPPAAAKAPRIRLSWRSSLIWPAEIAPSPPVPGAGRINLTWK
jgi:hypothetical protein